MAGEEKFWYFCLSEGTEGEEGSFSSRRCCLSSCVCGADNWLLIDLVLLVKNVAKSSAVKEVVGGSEGGQSRELNVLKRLSVSDALLILLWKYEDLAVWTSAEKDESKDWYILRSDGSFDLRHFLSAVLSLDRCSQSQVKSPLFI